MDVTLSTTVVATGQLDDRMAVAIQKKALDTQQQQGQAELRLIQEAALPPVTLTKGRHINLLA